MNCKEEEQVEWNEYSSELSFLLMFHQKSSREYNVNNGKQDLIMIKVLWQGTVQINSSPAVKSLIV